MSISAGSARRRVAADNFGGQCPLTMRTGSFANRNCPSNARYRYCGGSGYAPQSPPCERGVPRHRRGGGIKGLQVSTLAYFFGKASSVNPSDACGTSSLWQGSLAGSARGQCAPGWSVFVTSLTRPVSLLRWQWVCTSKPPLPKGGASAPPRRGDKRLAGFYIGLFLWKSLLCESLRCLWYQLPLAREPLACR